MTELRQERRNWWKVAFWTLLVIFEITREFLVLTADNDPSGGNFRLYGDDSYVHAEGQWARSDGGSPLVAKASTIECFKQWNTCIETNAELIPSAHVIQIFTDLHDIDHFNDREVTYSNASPICAKYNVRIDRVQSRVFATRDRKQVLDAACPEMETRVAMELRSGIDLRFERDVTKDHFVPIVHALVKLIELVD